MGATTLKPGAKKASGEDELDEEGADETEKNVEEKGPPGFYEEDLEKYYRKFEASRNARNEFKQRMKGKIIFTDTKLNHNVERSGTSHGSRPSKQVIKVVNGMAQTLKTREYEKPANLTQ